jgi:hypothetical protein
MYAAIFTAGALGYLTIYALEAPIRFVLYLVGKDWAILVRDGLVLGPLAMLFVAQLARFKVNPAFLVFAALMAFHGVVTLGSVGSSTAVAYGIKILVNLLFGYMLAAALLVPTRRVLWIILALWVVTLIGVGLDKFVVTFPWNGIKTVIGDLNVDVSKDWDIQDPLARRVAGFTRSSISVASLMPLLSIVLMCATRSLIGRAILAAATMVAVFLTTQKGSLIAFMPVAALLCLPGRSQAALNRQIVFMRMTAVTFILLAVGLPFLTAGLIMPHGEGVFSTSSFYMRIAGTWPDALDWIERHQIFVFGVGIGGISGPQRIYAPSSFNPADNVFLLLYAYFGVFAILYLTLVAWLTLRPVTGSPQRVLAALSIIAFQFGYGTVLSIIEDQAAAIFLGAAVAILLLETRRSGYVAEPGHFITIPSQARRWINTKRPVETSAAVHP